MSKRLDLNTWYQLRWRVLERDRFTCQYCGKTAPSVVLEVDHKTALADGGTNDLMNLITTCTACHKGKTADWHTGPSSEMLVLARNELTRFLSLEVHYNNECEYVSFDHELFTMWGPTEFTNQAIREACDELVTVGRLDRCETGGYELRWKRNKGLPDWLHQAWENLPEPMREGLPNPTGETVNRG